MLIRTLSALQDRANLSLRILLYYLAISAVGLAAEHYLIERLLGPGHAGVKFVIDTSFRVGVGLVLYIFATRLIRSQESARAHSMESTLELLERLALASEYRDDVTAAHNSRIGEYAAIVADQMGIPFEEREIIRYAASLHDIGKVAIPDRVLQKPGPLTEAERQEMQRHVLYGADLLLGGGHPVMDAAYNIALTHHEAWDGSGYPNGLSGVQIPLCGRIIALCDTYDALISERPYKHAWSSEEAVIEILRQSGKRFDPIVVNAFYKSLPRIQELDKRPQPGKTIREAPCYLPMNSVMPADPAKWYPTAVKEAQDENDRALGQIILKVASA